MLLIELFLGITTIIIIGIITVVIYSHGNSDPNDPDVYENNIDD